MIAAKTMNATKNDGNDHAFSSANRLDEDARAFDARHADRRTRGNEIALGQHVDATAVDVRHARRP